jgi:NDP-sugar pyrophosphorylase family protein
MRKLIHSISSRLLASELRLEYFGENIDITNISTLFNADLGSLAFSTTPLKIDNKGFVVTAIVDKCVSVVRNSVIGPNCNLTNGVLLGSNVRVGSNTVIGCDGFGYEINSNGVPIHFPHLGRVIINN